MNVLNRIVPNAQAKCCRFHLEEAWWRKVQSVGLVRDCNDKDSEIGKWLKKFFGIPFLRSCKVPDAFVEDLMSDAPYDDRCVKILELTDVYISPESTFPPQLWADSPSSSRRTNNGPESFHSHFNGQFYSKHSNIYIFSEVILIIMQACSYIRILNIIEEAPRKKRIFGLQKC